MKPRCGPVLSKRTVELKASGLEFKLDTFADATHGNAE